MQIRTSGICSHLACCWRHKGTSPWNDAHASGCSRFPQNTMQKPVRGEQECFFEFLENIHFLDLYKLSEKESICKMRALNMSSSIFFQVHPEWPKDQAIVKSVSPGEICQVDLDQRRGYCPVTFLSPASRDHVLQDKFFINGQKVDTSLGTGEMATRAVHLISQMESFLLQFLPLQMFSTSKKF